MSSKLLSNLYLQQYVRQNPEFYENCSVKRRNKSSVLKLEKLWGKKLKQTKNLFFQVIFSPLPTDIQVVGFYRSVSQVHFRIDFTACWRSLEWLMFLQLLILHKFSGFLGVGNKSCSM